MISGFSFRYSFSKHRSYFFQLYKLLGFNPKKLPIYQLAFTHSSLNLSDNDGNPLNNERLEFVGDAILGAAVADSLYCRFKNEDEGRLTLMRSTLVSRKSLDSIAEKAGILNFLNTRTTNAPNQHIAGNTLEALVGAIYYDRGYYYCKKYVDNLIATYVHWETLKTVKMGFKAILLEKSQHNKWVVDFSTYEALETNEKKYHFITQLLINKQFIAEGKAWSRKEAELQAAKKALNIIESENLHFD